MPSSTFSHASSSPQANSYAPEEPTVESTRSEASFSGAPSDESATTERSGSGIDSFSEKSATTENSGSGIDSFSEKSTTTERSGSGIDSFSTEGPVKDFNEKPTEAETRSDEQESSQEPAQADESSPTDEEDIRSLLSSTTEKYLRLAAEFENYRKRQKREQESFRYLTQARLIESLLPVLDDLERVEERTHQPKATLKELKEGILLVINKFKQKLQDQGVRDILISRGDTFDPDLHEALAQAPAPEPALRGKILAVIEKGYRLEDRILRYAKVQTATHE